MATTKILWTESTWNPVTGCTPISAGCDNCYALPLAKRLKAMGQPKYRNGFKTTCHPETLDIPHKWKKPHLIFVNSMSDLFHKDVPDEFIEEVFSTMNETPRHTYQVLTKRADRILEVSRQLDWTPNIWMGVTVENADHIDRIDHLREIPAAVRFLSLEPLLGPLSKLNLDGIDWVIVAGESGPGARPLEKEWVQDLRDQCVEAEVPFFFKQWGGVRKMKAGRELDGRTWDEYPAAYEGN